MSEICSPQNITSYYMGLNPDQGTALCSWSRLFTLTVVLSTRVYKWVPANFLLGVTLHWSSIPSRESRNTPSCLFCTYNLVKKSNLSKQAQETHTVELEEYFKN